MKSADGAGIVVAGAKQNSGVWNTSSSDEAGDMAAQPSLYAELARVAVASIVITTAAWLFANYLLETLGVPFLS